MGEDPNLGKGLAGEVQDLSKQIMPTKNIESLLDFESKYTLYKIKLKHDIM